MVQLHFDQWTSLFAVAAMQGFFLVFLLYNNPKGNKRANRLLALYILLFSLMIVYFVAWWANYHKINVHINLITDTFLYLYGPLLFGYLFQLRDNKWPVNFKYHFIPFLLQVTLNLPFYLSSSEGKKAMLALSRQAGSMQSYWMLGQEIFSNLSLVIYSLLLLYFVYKSSADSISNLTFLKWMRKVAWFFTGYVISSVSYYTLLFSGLIRPEYDYAISFAMTAFIYATGYLGFRQPELFNRRMEVRFIPEARYEKSSLTDMQAKSILQRLLLLMEAEKPFTDSELKIHQLALKLGVSSHHLSQIINEKLKQNFADFINTFRIKEAQALLVKPEYQREKILSIAFDSGFSNKATFYAAFKKYTGISPANYRQKALKELFDPVSIQ